MMQDAEKLFADEAVAVEESSLAGKKVKITFGLGVICLLILAAVLVVYFNVEQKEKDLKENIEKRLELIAESRAGTLSGWLSDFSTHGGRIFKSELFRWYASNVDLLDASDFSTLVMGDFVEGGEETAGLSAQLPMMKRLLEEFSRYSGFLSARIVNKNSVIYIATDAGNIPLSNQQKALVTQTLTEGLTFFSPVKYSQSGIVIDIYMPVMSLEGGAQGKKPVSVLVLTRVITDKLSSILAGTPLSNRGERTRLIQKNDSIFQEVIPWLPGELGLPERQMVFSEDASFPFADRTGVDGSTKVYSVGKKIPELDWWIVQEIDFDIAGQEIRNFKRIAYVITFIVAAASALLLGSIWWRMVGIESRKAAVRNYRLARQIEKQKEFLDSITDSIVEYICLKNSTGSYLFVNNAFAQAAGREPSEMIGLDDSAVFGYDTAQRLNGSDQKVLSENCLITVKEKVFLQSRVHHVQITKVPFRGSSGDLSGILSVYSDITDMVDAQEKSIQAVGQTIDVLVRTIELRDRYLSGHSRLMKEIASAVAQKMGADDLGVATVRTAANLSQIGKLFVDRDLLNKPGALSREEKKEIEKHVTYAGDVLKDFDFGLPIYDAICQMNELLDGTGYPKGLAGDEICFSARILAVVNTFCAMVKPRVYRPALPLTKVLGTLAESPEKYDPRVVEKLKDVVGSPLGEKLLKDADA